MTGGYAKPTIHIRLTDDRVHPVYSLEEKRRIGSVAEVPESDMWAWVAEQIRHRPKYTASATGIEQIGYLTDIRPPVPVPSLTDLEVNYFDNAEVSRPERRKVRGYWRDFIEVAKISSIKDIEDKTGVIYRAELKRRGWKTRTRRTAYSAVKRVLRFGVEQAIGTEHCQSALLKLAGMRESAKQSAALKSQPISREDFNKLLDAAVGDNKALLLMMLNCALYIQEVCRVRWDEIVDGCFISRRAKTENPIRVGVLWPETLAELAKVERKGDCVFYAATGLPLTVSGAGKRFRVIRRNANLPSTVTGSHLRDGAAQAMMDAGVKRTRRKLVLGHKTGMEDQYVMRKPQMVAKATAAIRARYFG